MASLSDLSLGELRHRLTDDGGTTDKRTMAAIAHRQGVPTGELAAWFEVEEETIEEWIAEVVSDVEQAGHHEPGDGGNRRTEPEPLAADQTARVEYLDYEALTDHGWAIDDEDLFEKAEDADLDESAHGIVWVDGDESILEAAESEGLVWPYSCRGGACANCAAVCKEGSVYMPANQILPAEAVQDRQIRLTCIGRPASADVRLVVNAKHLESLEEILLPPQEASTPQ